MEIRALRFDSIEEYARVPISFEVRQRLKVLDGGRFEAVAVDPPWIKDYDGFEGEGPRSYAPRFEVSTWGVLGAFEDFRLVGGAMIAFRCPEFDLLEGRLDLAHVVDIRVAPALRGQGVGRLLWERAETWVRDRAGAEIRVETQDINLPACRFYQAMGCSLLSCAPDAYGAEIDEVQLIWGKRL